MKGIIMVRKLIAILMIATVLCGMFIGCGKGENSTDPSGSSVPNQTSSVPTDDATGDTQNASQPSGTDTTPIESTPANGDSEPTTGNQGGTQTPSVQGGGSQEVVVDPTEETGPLFPEATNVSAPESDEITYLDYHNMSADEQKAFINTFASVADFVAWHAAAKKEYEDSLIEYDGSTPVDAEEIFGGN